MAKVPIAGELAQEFVLSDSTRVPRRLSELVSHGRLVFASIAEHGGPMLMDKSLEM
jgi:hypothetical protein